MKVEGERERRVDTVCVCVVFLYEGGIEVDC